MRHSEKHYHADFARAGGNFVLLAYIARLTRAGVIEELKQPHIARRSSKD